MKRVVNTDEEEAELPSVTVRVDPPDLRQRSVKRGKDYFLQKQRESRERNKLMGVIQVGAQIPERDKEAFLLYARKLVAVHMLEICEKYDAASPMRIAMANRNFATVPLLADIEPLYGTFDGAFDKRLKDCAMHIEKFYQANAGLNQASTERTGHDAVVIFASLAVAHSYMASSLWEGVCADIAELTRKGG